MRRLFLDTGYLIALEAADDQHHQIASSHWDLACVAARWSILFEKGESERG